MLNDVMEIDMSFHCSECGRIGLLSDLVSITATGMKRFCPNCHTTILKNHETTNLD